MLDGSFNRRVRVDRTGNGKLLKLIVRKSRRTGDQLIDDGFDLSGNGMLNWINYYHFLLVRRSFHRKCFNQFLDVFMVRFIGRNQQSIFCSIYVNPGLGKQWGKRGTQRRSGHIGNGITLKPQHRSLGKLLLNRL